MNNLAFCADKPKLPNNFEEVTWSKIKEAVTAIHLKQPVSCSLEELYRVCCFFGGVSFMDASCRL
jgi:hypothetical protein